MSTPATNPSTNPNANNGISRESEILLKMQELDEDGVFAGMSYQLEQSASDPTGGSVNGVTSEKYAQYMDALRQKAIKQLTEEEGFATVTTLNDAVADGVWLTPTLQLRVNKVRNELSINDESDNTACILDFEVRDGAIDCVYFDSGLLNEAQ
jgi:hypothetical protein